VLKQQDVGAVAQVVHNHYPTIRIIILNGALRLAYGKRYVFTNAQTIDGLLSQAFGFCKHLQLPDATTQKNRDCCEPPDNPDCDCD